MATVCCTLFCVPSGVSEGQGQLDSSVCCVGAFPLLCLAFPTQTSDWPPSDGATPLLPAPIIEFGASDTSTTVAFQAPIS